MDRDRDAEPQSRGTDYAGARVKTAGALTAVTIFLLVFDALSPTYALDPVIFGLLMGGIATLLGIAGLDKVTGR